MFTKIAEVVEDPEISQYIPLLQKPKMLPENFFVTKMYMDTSLKEAKTRLYEFKVKAEIPENLFFLMELLYIKCEEPITLEELQKTYSEYANNISLNSLKVNLSKVRKILKDNPDQRLELIKRRDGYKMISYYF